MIGMQTIGIEQVHWCVRQQCIIPSLTITEGPLHLRATYLESHIQATGISREPYALEMPSQSLLDLSNRQDIRETVATGLDKHK